MDFNGWKTMMRNNRRRILFSLLLLAIAIAAYYASGDYVTDRQNSVVSPDLILDNIGPYNLSFIFVWLFIAVITVGLLYPLIFKPKELPYVLNMFSLFVLIRSGFIVFTHLRAPYDAIHSTFPGFWQTFNFTNDLFFSAHTGVPFLGFLIFRKHHKGISYFMLASSIMLAITVLLMHVHYSIDVLSAYFITYGIYEIGAKWFKWKDYE
ncbi:sphingomyelin synthase family protein [Candidatus Pacearchaeota archaeon]|nr:sphingomyelin synthase family protein [Candidatus Pacearchaeota archaeon]